MDYLDRIHCFPKYHFRGTQQSFWSGRRYTFLTGKKREREVWIYLRWSVRRVKRRNPDVSWDPLALLLTKAQWANILLTATIIFHQDSLLAKKFSWKPPIFHDFKNASMPNPSIRPLNSNLLKAISIILAKYDRQFFFNTFSLVIRENISEK